MKSKSNKARDLARALRKKSTPAERVFWEAVRNRKFLGKKFYRQRVYHFSLACRERFFIIDFYCHEDKLGVEIDGPYHQLQEDYDEIRAAFIKASQVRLVRFTNEEVLYNLDSVLSELEIYLTQPEKSSINE
jgi:very-short-patch-repair endonuclease